MQVPISEAKAQLTDLVRRAEAGEEVVLTRHGKPAVRLSPVTPEPLNLDDRRAALEAICERASAKALPGPSAARSQDYLYDDDGLPA